jgi:signal transduction histidine kinase
MERLMPVDVRTLASLQELRAAARTAGDWKAALDQLLAVVREEFVYDNVALYLLDAQTGSVEVGHARAVGRGRSAEADISWGEGIAGKVISQKEVIIQEPEADPQQNRLAAPHLIGLPVRVGGQVEGALVFVRFGGPTYSEVHRLLAAWIADTVGSLLETRALQEARGELRSVQRQMRLQDDFVSSISHELRTPLGFIKGYTTSLLREDTTWDDKTQREFLSIIEDETDRLSHLIENMLESARFQSQTAKFRFQPLQVDALVRDVTVRARARRPELQVQLEFERVPPILGDGLRLTQVFENLFSNAIKYAPGSPVTIRMSHDQHTLHIAFEDRGPGIPEEYLPFLFQRFYRVPAESSSTGTGLGLYICHQIILAHHGKIWAESVLDRGTTFIVELPLQSSK